MLSNDEATDGGHFKSSEGTGFQVGQLPQHTY